jgi:hypothetical protein
VGGSGYFDGTGDFLSAANNAAFNFGSGAFTIEFWYYPITLSGTQCLITNYGGSTTGFVIQMGGSTAGSGKIDAGFSGDGADITSTNSVQLNSWNHIAVSGTPGATGIKLFINGNQEGSTYTGATSLDTSATLLIGEVASTNRLSGYLSGLRLLKGTALYTASTYTVPTAPLTAITNTSLLLNYTNAGITDATSKNDLETVGNAQISTTQSKWGGGSMYFDGTSTTGLTIPNSSLLTLGSGDWSIEFWIYRVGNSTTQGVFDQRTAAATEIRPLIYINSSNQIVYYTNGADRITASLSQNTWVYVAVVKSSGVTRMYIDGTVQATTYTDTNTYLAPTNQTRIGRLIDGFPLNGYIDDFRITLGRARTTTASPTAPFPVQ